MTSTNSTAQMTAESLPANLREPKKAQAASRKAAAKKVPAKAAAKEATAKAATDAKPKLKWIAEGERGKSPQHAVAADGTKYSIVRRGDKWAATVAAKGKQPVTLVENVSMTSAYYRAVAHRREGK